MFQPGWLRSGAVARALLLAPALLLTPCAAVLAQPTFTDVTGSAGESYLQHTAQLFPNCIFGGFCEPERMTGGAAVADVDGDGYLDLYVTLLDAPDILFLNQGNGTFQDASSAAGLGLFDCHANGIAFGDIDNDGDQDLYVGVMGAANDAINNRNYLFINDGSGIFAEEAVSRGAGMASPADRRIYSVTLGDYNRDGYLDLHATEWLRFTVSHSRLLRNLGVASPGSFDDVTTVAGVDLSGVEGFASTFTDLDGDGWPELAVAGDFGTSRLFWNVGDGSFSDGTVAAGVGTDENGMGSTFGDVDGDGDLDWFVTSIFDADETCETQSCNWGYSGNRLFRNEGGRAFSDATDAAGVRDGYWGWGTVFFDYDNDGDLDLVMTNGVDFTTPLDTKYVDDPMRFWENDGNGVMTEKSAVVGLTDTGSGKGLLTFDYDDDGDLDLFVVNNAAGPRLYRNDGGNNKGWLRVQTVGSVSNRDGVGAWITLQAAPGGPVQVREMGTAGHFLGQSERVAHFGLGDGASPVHKVTVKWPSGAVQEFLDVARNATLVASEPACGSPLPACPGAGTAGAVPDGWAHTPGAPLTVEHAAGSSLKLSWAGSCDPTDTNYNVYEGTLGDFTSHAPAGCGTGGATTTTLTPAAGDTYYLVVPADGGVEGSYGRKGDDTPRSPGGSACLPQAVGSCS